MAEPVPSAPPPVPRVESAGHGGKVYVINHFGNVEEHTPEDAARLVYSHGWTPVSRDDAVKLDSSGILREMATPADAIGQGFSRGLTGGLVDLGISKDEERERDAVDQAFPWLTPAAEGVGFLAPMGFGSGLSAVGEGVTTGARALLGEGLGAKIVSRATGLGVEGSVYGGIQAARDAQIEDTPLTAQRLLSGAFGGAAVGGLLGSGIGALEGAGAASKSLLRRFTRETAGARGELSAAGLRDNDVKAILERQGIPAAPGALEELQARLYNDPNITPEFLASIKASPGIRDDVFGAAHPQRAAAEANFAKALDQLHQVQDEALAGWSGKLKREQVQKWIPDDEHFVSDQQRFVDHVNGLGLEERNRLADDIGEDVRKAFRSEGEAGSADVTRKGGEPIKGPVRELMNSMAVGSEDQLVKNVQRGVLSGNKNVLDALFESRVLNDENLGKLLGKRTLPAWKQASLDLLDSMGAKVGGMQLQPKGYVGEGAGGKIKELSGLLAGARDKILAGDRANAFAELDYVKKRLGSFRGEGYLSIGEGPEAAAQGMHEEARRFLENPSVWGDKAAGAQRDMNALLHKRLARNDDFYKAFYSGSGAPDPRNPWAEGISADPKKIQSMMDKLVDPTNSKELALFKTHIAETGDMANLMKKYYALDPTGASRVIRAEESVKNAQKAMDDALHANLRINQGDVLRKGTGVGNGGIGLAGMVGGMLFGRSGAIAGAAARAAFDLSTNPGKALYYRALIERALGAHSERIATAVSGFAGKVSRAASEVARSSGRVVGSVEKLGYDTVENQRAYKDTLSDLAAMASNRDAVVAELGRVYGPGLLHTPAATMHMADSIMRAAQFLLAAAPVKPEPGLFGDDFGIVTDSEMVDWSKQVAAAMDPTSIVHMAADGTLTPESVAAAEVAAPELMQSLRGDVMHYVTTVGPEKLTAGGKLGVSVLFGVPSGPRLNPTYIALQQQLYVPAEPPKGAGGDAFSETGLTSDYSKTAMGQSDRLESPEVPR